jgi:hypothetical protein
VEPFLILAVAVTSLGGYLIGVRWRGRSPATLRDALARLLECLGATAVFAVVNVTLAAVIIVGIRAFTQYFVTLYLLDDALWLIVSLLQGITWSLWRPDRRS